ncbi:hypothetical protein [Pseudolabrys sp. Root1462]|uniref:hypothetical protein n=1 Tax=Pseudolabrys sp. Root1462 TaxID=1736466 RepID=UPI0012E33078|nr:hypothetical protein [Pseudolabrys sp. Root1462]
MHHRPQGGFERIGLGVNRHKKPGAFGKLVAAAVYELTRRFVYRQHAVGEGLRDVRADRRQISVLAGEDEGADKERLQRQGAGHRQESGDEYPREQCFDRQLLDPFEILEGGARNWRQSFDSASERQSASEEVSLPSD